MKIKNQPQAERPRERCLREGAQSLSLRECIALILGSGPPGLGCLGVAEKVISGASEESFFRALEAAPGAAFKNRPGLGPASEAKLLATFEFARRYARFSQTRTQAAPLSQPRHKSIVANALKKVPLDLRNASKEWLGFIPVYDCGKLGTFVLAERGVRTHINIDPRELFAQILTSRPLGFLLFHNHPSGNLTPSAADQDLTDRIREVSEQIGLKFFGHWIVCHHGSTKI